MNGEILSLEDLESNVATGDIFLMQGRGIPSWIIRFGTRSVWSHVVMVVKEPNIANGQAMIWECTRHHIHHNIITRAISTAWIRTSSGEYVSEDGNYSYNYKEGGISLSPLIKQLKKYEGKILAWRKLVVPETVRQKWHYSIKPILESFIGGISLTIHYPRSVATTSLPSIQGYSLPVKAQMVYPGSSMPVLQTTTKVSETKDVLVNYDDNYLDLCMSQRGCLFIPESEKSVHEAGSENGGLNRSFFCSSLLAATWYKMGILNPQHARSKLPVECAPCDFSEGGSLEFNTGFYLEEGTIYIDLK